jgi:protein-disulfide isomerase-like protein with CxxC motif
MDNRGFAVTWDYLCPFARNAHEHLVAGLEAGAPWDVTFVPFSLMQAHVEEGDPPVWDHEEKARGVLALEAGIVVRDRFPNQFLAAHRALFAARHDEGKELGDPAVVRSVLQDVGVPADEVFASINEGWPLDALRTAHEKSVAEHEVFGVPTFIVGDAAVFVRVMTRPEGDGARARTVIDRLVALIVERPELNEFKHTSIPR